LVMPQNFVDCDREQAFLLPPSLRDWLPADHLAWFVIDAVAELDLAAFYAAYRADGHGRAAYDPSMMVTLVLYSFAVDERSSRSIERHCRQDVAFRVISGNVVPDHATVARFLIRHEAALGDLFTGVLSLCARAGLVASGVVAVDGTKISGNAHRDRSLDYDEIAREIIAETIATDVAEDEAFGDARGDELPEALRTPEGRREWLRRELGREQDPPPGEDEADGFDTDRIVDRIQGREGWAREAHRQLEAERWRAAVPVAHCRSQRLRDAAVRLEDEQAAKARGMRVYEAWRAGGYARNGRRFGRPPHPWQSPPIPPGVINLSDPDSQLMKGMRNYVQGYNAQAVVNAQQIILAAEITNAPGDFAHLRPMIQSMSRELIRAGVTERPGLVLADAGYWNDEHINDVICDEHLRVLIPPDGGKRKGPRRGWTGGLYDWMRHLLDTDHGREIYRQRRQTIEPVFGHTKHNRGFTRFHHRGRLAVQTEWRLMMSTHNLTKLYHHQLATG
jgi:transposase